MHSSKMNRRRQPNVPAVLRGLPLFLLLALGAGVALAQDAPKLEGGQEGSVLESMTIEGEDRIHIEFERPELRISLDPLQVPGLEGEDMELLLAGSEPDLLAPFLASSVRRRSPYFARPWFDALTTGTLVTFRPDLEGVERWSLMVADSQGDTVAVFGDDRKPPKEIAWDGGTLDGAFALPGLVHSYVLTAWDKAGNKRSFVGDGFELPPYFAKRDEAPTILFAGRHLEASAPERGTEAPLLYEVANLLQQSVHPDRTLELTVKARRYEQARALAERVGAGLRTLVPGDPARLLTHTFVEPQAPADGIVRIAATSPAGED